MPALAQVCTLVGSICRKAKDRMNMKPASIQIHSSGSPECYFVHGYGEIDHANFSGSIRTN